MWRETGSEKEVEKWCVFESTWNGMEREIGGSTFRGSESLVMMSTRGKVTLCMGHAGAEMGEFASSKEYN